MAALKNGIPLRKQMARVMFILAVVPLALLFTVGAMVTARLIIQSEQNVNMAYRDVFDVIGYGFVQNEQYQLYTITKIAQSFLPQDSAAETEALGLVYQELLDKGIPAVPDTFFIARDGRVVATAGQSEMTVEELERQFLTLVNPTLADTFSHLEDASELTLEKMLVSEETLSFYPTGLPAEMYMISWVTLQDGTRFGAFSTSLSSMMLIDTVDSLVAEHRAGWASTVHRLMLYGGTAIALVLTVLVAAILYFSKKLSKSVSAQVERREREQDELLHRAEEEKAMLESLNQMKTEFLSNVSHELKTPLTVISSHMQVGQQKLADLPGMEDLDRRMRLVSGEAERMALMVGQLLDVGRIDEGRMTIEPQPEPVVEIIQNTLNTYYPVFLKNGNELRFSPAGSSPSVLCDRLRVTQVLVNLISNASKHTQDGVITVSVSERDDFADITVKDTGSGIPERWMPHLFERYNSRLNMEHPAGRDTGTGLGLYICKHIVEAHGGGIKIESKPGEGTVVTFTLPIAPIAGV